MQEVVQAIVWALLNSSWQSALLWIAYLSFYQNSCAASKKQFLLTGIIAQMVATTGLTFFHLTGQQPVYSLSYVSNYSWEPLVFGVYLLILATRLVRAYLSFKTFSGWSKGLLKAPASLQLFTTQKAILLGINRRVSLWISEQNLVPHARGLFKPIVVLPASLLLNLSPRDTEAIILHELAHIRHRDLWSNYLVIFSELVYYFNPFTLMMIREFRLQREIRCDERVLDFGYPVAGYCQALYLTALNYIQKPPYALALAGESDLLTRIRLMVRKPETNKNTGIIFLLPIFFILLVTGVFTNRKSHSIPIVSMAPQLAAIKEKNLAIANSHVEIAKPVQTKALASIEQKTIVSRPKAKTVVQQSISKQSLSPDTVAQEVFFVNYSPPDSQKEIVVVEEGSDGKIIKMIFILQTIRGTPQIIPLIQFIQTLPDSSRNLKDSIAEF